MRTTPYIRLILTIAILVAVAPPCATAVVCGSCGAEAACFADEHGVPGEVTKRPVLIGAPSVVCALAVPADSAGGIATLRDIRREAAPAPAARMRV